jgi:hypothetical protein
MSEKKKSLLLRILPKLSFIILGVLIFIEITLLLATGHLMQFQQTKAFEYAIEKSLLGETSDAEFDIMNNVINNLDTPTKNGLKTFHYNGFCNFGPKSEIYALDFIFDYPETWLFTKEDTDIIFKNKNQQETFRLSCYHEGITHDLYVEDLEERTHTVIGEDGEPIEVENFVHFSTPELSSEPPVALIQDCYFFPNTFWYEDPENQKLIDELYKSIR